MRREHIISESYIDWLKSLGCLVYLPLSDNGDLEDKISGVSAQTTGYGTFNWDANRNGYIVKSPSSGLPGRSTLLLDNGFTTTWFPNNEITVLQTVEMITKTSGCGCRTLSPKSSTTTTIQAISAAYNGSGNCNAWPNGYRDIGYTTNPSIRNYYQDGGLFRSYTAYSPFLPLNWTMNGTGLFIGTGEGSTYTNTEFSIKNIYIFNRVLDLTTIRKIQGYE